MIIDVPIRVFTAKSQGFTIQHTERTHGAVGEARSTRAGRTVARFLLYSPEGSSWRAYAQFPCVLRTVC